MTVLETDRLLLTPLSYDHGDFICELVNEPAFKRFIGDKDVHSAEDARRYLREGPIGLSERFGYGMFLVTLKSSHIPAGICGLLKREGLEDPDLGFAFLGRFTGRGYAREAAQAVLRHGVEDLGLTRVIAIADPENEPSISLLHKLGFRYERKVRMPADDYDINLYAIET